MRQCTSPHGSRGEGEMSKGTARKVGETPMRRDVRTIVVEDGDAKDAPSRKSPPQAPQSQGAPKAPLKAPQGRRAPDVRFESLDAAASKIQAVYRSYTMRKTEPLKHLRLICKVKSELQDLVRKSCRSEEVEKLRNDPQVRLRWTEGILELIFRLDSLQGVHPAVRVSRKSMAKDLIRFQESVGSMADAAKEKSVVDYVDPVEEDSNVEAENEDTEISEDTNVPDETEKKTALQTEDSSDSSALVLQLLEENRKLQAVVGEVLQWGEQQNEVINKLTSRIKQLEGEVSNVKLLKDCIHSGRKRADGIAIPIGNRERLVRLLEISNGPQTNFICR